MAGEETSLGRKALGRLSRGWAIGSPVFRRSLNEELTRQSATQDRFELLGADRSEFVPPPLSGQWRHTYSQLSGRRRAVRDLNPLPGCRYAGATADVQGPCLVSRYDPVEAPLRLRATPSYIRPCIADCGACWSAAFLTRCSTALIPMLSGWLRCSMPRWTSADSPNAPDASFGLHPKKGLRPKFPLQLASRDLNPPAQPEDRASQLSRDFAKRTGVESGAANANITFRNLSTSQSSWEERLEMEAPTGVSSFLHRFQVSGGTRTRSFRTAVEPFAT